MKWSGRRLVTVFVAVLALGAVALPAWADQISDGATHAQSSDETVTASADKVLILGNTVSGGASSREAVAASSLGFTVDVVTDATWAGMTTADFTTYRAIIIGDPTCSNATSWAAASANPGVWGPAVSGNVIAIGTDPVYHYSGTGAPNLINKAMAFATGIPGRTGFYADTSCEFTAAATLLNYVESGWTSAAPPNCADSIHIVATNPYLLGLTDADLSGWSCSVHAIFNTWPSDFIPIALDTDAAPVYTADDGTSGTPYILGRGEGLSSTNILLSPDTTTVPTGGSATLTALVQFGGTPVAGTTVTFTIVSGLNAGFTGTAVSDAGGIATFVYTSDLPGSDVVEASFVNPNGVTEVSNSVTVTWDGVILVAPRFTG